MTITNICRVNGQLNPQFCYGTLKVIRFQRVATSQNVLIYVLYKKKHSNRWLHFVVSQNSNSSQQKLD